MLKEFREFALRGNVVDLAVGVIIGAAFGAIVTSLVNDVLMPPIGMLLGGVDFKDLFLVLKPAAGTAKAVTMNIGLFLNTVISFLLVAFSVFMVVKAINTARRAPAPAAAAPPAPTASEALLMEIRDLLKARR